MAADSIAITGTGGMIGHNLGLLLAGLGRSVVGIDSQQPTQDLPFDQVVADINDAAELTRVFREHRVDSVVHAAAISGPMVQPQDPALLFEVNVRGTHTVLQVSRDTQVKRVVFLSSIAAYGERLDDHPVAEQEPLLASDPYGASKVAAEAIVRSYGQLPELQTVSLRLGMVYGPGRRTACPIRDTLLAAQQGRSHSVPYGRGWNRQYIFVEDVTEAIQAALDADLLQRPAYNVSSGELCSMEDVARTIGEAVTGARLVLEGVGHPYDSRIGPLNIEAARNDLGFHPQIPLIDGVRRYWEWLVAHR